MNAWIPIAYNIQIGSNRPESEFRKHEMNVFHIKFSRIMYRPPQPASSKAKGKRLKLHSVDYCFPSRV